MIASLTSCVNALVFDVNRAAKIAPMALLVHWSSKTPIVFVNAIQGRIVRQRQWRICRFSLSFSFVTLSLWVPILPRTPTSPRRAAIL